MEKDEEQGLQVEIHAADHGYDDTENHYLLETKGMHAAIILNDYRTQKKDKNKEVWIKLKKTREYEAGKRQGDVCHSKPGRGKQPGAGPEMGSIQPFTATERPF